MIIKTDSNSGVAGLAKLLVLVTLFASAYSYAEHKVAPNTITLAVPNGAPWTSDYKRSQLGIVDHYIDLFTRDSEFNILTMAMPYPRMLQSLKGDSVDFALGTYEKSLEEYAFPIMKVGRLAVVLYSRKPLESLYEDKGKTLSIGMLRGADMKKDYFRPHWKGKSVSREISAIQATAKGRLDAAIVTRNSYEHAAQNSSLVAKGNMAEIGFIDVFIWANKSKIGNMLKYKSLIDKVKENSLNGSLILDWYSANMNRSATINNLSSTATP